MAALQTPAGGARLPVTALGTAAVTVCQHILSPREETARSASAIPAMTASLTASNAPTAANVCQAVPALRYPTGITDPRVRRLCTQIPAGPAQISAV